MTSIEDIQKAWRARWADPVIERPTCFNRPAFSEIVTSSDFPGVEYQNRMSRNCPHWAGPGANAFVMGWCDSAGGKRTPWSACNGCQWRADYLGILI